MIQSIIDFSVRNKLLVLLLVLGLVVAGLRSMGKLSIDAVPDITNNQVQIVTTTSHFAAQEMEQAVTYPIENAMRNLPDVVEVRSISRFGLSLITVVFDDRLPTLQARQLVKEQIDMVELPPGYGKPELMPITTGLGEVYQYVLTVDAAHQGHYSLSELRSIQDRIVKRLLAGTPGIIEVSSFGGRVKQYEVEVQPELLQAYALSLTDVGQALERNNENSGSGYIEKGHLAYYIRSQGRVEQLSDIEQIVVARRKGQPVLVRDVAKVRFGSAPRFGAMTMDGKGEVVGGIALMLKGANSMAAVAAVKDAVERMKPSLPAGVSIYPYLERSLLVNKTIHTVEKNLIEGGLIVILVLVLLLGNLRAGFIVASLIPLSMLFAFVLMQMFGVSANLMSLGAIDFGIIVDGAVIIVEGVLHALAIGYAGQRLDTPTMNDTVSRTAGRIYGSAAYGVLIILIVFVPILSLTGIEGKMFQPMALTVGFALLGALLLSMTYVPMMTAWLLPKRISDRPNLADRFMHGLERVYNRMLAAALRRSAWIFSGALLLLLLALGLFARLGQEFIPTLEEGDLAMQMTLQPGSSLSESIASCTKIEKRLLERFPEIRHIVSKIGTAEVPTDPMAIETADIMLVLKDKSEWTSAHSRSELAERIKSELEVFLGIEFEISQPIQLRFNELMTGSKTDIAIKIYGDDTDTLLSLAERAAQIVRPIPGAGDVKVEQTEGLLQKTVLYRKEQLALHGLQVSDLNALLQATVAGSLAGYVFEGAARYDLVVRLPSMQDLDLSRLSVSNAQGAWLPLSEVAMVQETTAAAQISHENARRKIDVGINVRDRDVAGLVADMQAALSQNLRLPPGYSIRYGGAFENLQAAKERLSVAVPFALALILVLLYLAFGRVAPALLIFSAVPFAAIGGVFALLLREMPFSISAGVGFIALFGVAVLNGIVLMSSYRQLQEQGMDEVRERVLQGSVTRLRPVLMTALVAALGFIPMALSESNGGEVQRPLATVVIGGLFSSTLLTLFVLPILYYWTNRKRKSAQEQAACTPQEPTDSTTLPPPTMLLLLLGLLLPALLPAQNVLTLQACQERLLQADPVLQQVRLGVDWHKTAEKTRWQPGNLTLAYTVGQINYAGIDHQAQVVQDFGNVFSYKQLQQYYRARTGQAQAELQQEERLELLILKRLYLEWQYHQRRLALLEERRQTWTEYERIAAQRRASGEADGLEAQMAALQGRQIEQSLHQQRYACLLAQREVLLRARYPEGDYLPTPLPDTLPTLPERLNPALAAPYQAQIQTLQRQADWWKRERSSPSFSLGAFAQTLDQKPLFSGMVLGLSVPIRPQTSIVLEQNQIEQQQSRLYLQTLQSDFERRLLWTKQNQAQLTEMLTRQTALYADLQQALSKTLERVRTGEAEYYEYYMLVQQSYDLRLQMVELHYQAARSVLELE